jgi:integrase
MSVYRPKNSPYYQFDFQVGGTRFHGTTGRTNRRDAEGVEKDHKEKAKAAAKAAKASGGGLLTLDTAAARYWKEVGEHHVRAKSTWTDLGRLVDYFGPAKLLAEVTDDDVAKLVQWRRSQRKWARETLADGTPVALLSSATVNRSTTEVLKKLFTRARRTWKYSFPLEPDWKSHRLAEPKERVRELRKDESAALDLATRVDYGPIFSFIRATGMRVDECILRWSEVNWETGWVETVGKGGHTVRTAITSHVRAILDAERGNNDEWVFTFVAQRTRPYIHRGAKMLRIRGQRYPITYSGLHSQWRRLRDKSGVVDFRMHDFRHDLATKLLRKSRNLKIVQKALSHQDIKTTSRYAHVLDEDVSSAMEELSTSQASDKKSRKKSRSHKKGVF